MTSRATRPDEHASDGAGQVPLLAALPEPDRVELLLRSRVVRVAPRLLLLRAGSDMLLVLLSGMATARSVAADGTSLVVALLGPRSVWGLPVVLGHPVAGADVVAASPAEALLVPGAEVRRRLAAGAPLLPGLVDSLAGELASAREESTRLAGTTTTQRVLERLLELADRWGQPTERAGQVRIVFPLTQEELASWAHVSRESTAKVLHDLRRDGIVLTGRRELRVMDLPALRARSRSGGSAQRLLRGLL